MSFRFLAMNHPEDPYLACRTAVRDHPLYRQCALCPHSGYCEIESLDLAIRQCEQMLADIRAVKKRELTEYYMKYRKFPPRPRPQEPQNSESKGFFYNLKKNAALNSEDPQKACQMRLSQHSHYFDCAHCEHNQKCEDGKREIELMTLELEILDELSR